MFWVLMCEGAGRGGVGYEGMGSAVGLRGLGVGVVLGAVWK